MDIVVGNINLRVRHFVAVLFKNLCNLTPRDRDSCHVSDISVHTCLVKARVRTLFQPLVHASLSKGLSRHTSRIRLGAPLTKGHRKSRQEAKRHHAPGYPKAQICPDAAYEKKKGVNKSSPAHTNRTEIAHRLVQRSKSCAFRTPLSLNPDVGTQNCRNPFLKRPRRQMSVEEGEDADAGMAGVEAVVHLDQTLK